VAIGDWIHNELAEQLRGAFLWSPIALGCGIAGYLALRLEPGLWSYVATGLVLSGLLVAAVVARPGWRQGLVLLAMVPLGFLLVGWEAHRLTAPVLSHPYYGAVTGRIIAVDRSQKNRPRITLDQVYLPGKPIERTPHKVRISLYYDGISATPSIGAKVAITGNLSPPSGPAEPGGFDFRRHAWFAGLGAIGYSRNPLVAMADPDYSGFLIRVARLREFLSRAIRDRIPGAAGGFAAAILTGDRSSIDMTLIEDMRRSNLAHLLAISGLHMGLLTGFVFAAIRYGLALIPPLALRVHIKKVAAIGALAVALAYLVLSGAQVATERAFIMVSVVLIAVLLDRRALSLRAVALAALLVLLIRPISLVEAGFQMSFAATTALVFVFRSLRDWSLSRRPKRAWLRALHWFAMLSLTSLVAGLATAPFSAFHFNQLSQYGLIANLASVPVMGIIVMPVSVVAALLAPIGVDGIAWPVVGAGIDWILAVASWVSDLEGAVRPIVKPATLVFGLIVAGALVLTLFHTLLRSLGVGAMCLGLVLWSQAERPDVLVAGRGGLVGVDTPAGRWINKAKGQGFVADSWLENDGDPGDQAAAATRRLPLKIGGYSIVIEGKKPFEHEVCRRDVLFIHPKTDPVRGPCLQVSKSDIRQSGAIAIVVAKDGLRIEGAQTRSGARLWSGLRQ